MEIKGRKVVVLGGYGEVGFAISRQILGKGPRELIVTSLRKEEALEAVEKLKGEALDLLLRSLPRQQKATALDRG